MAVHRKAQTLEGSNPRRCWVTALVVALMAIAYAWIDARVLRPSMLYRDVDQAWLAARALWHHQNPYELLGPGRTFDLPWPLYYPATAGVLYLPLGVFPVLEARLIFVGLSVFAFTFVITRDGYARLPVLLGGSFFVSVAAAQWAPLLVAAALTPAMSFVLLAKPHTGLALFAARLVPLTRRSVVIASVIGFVIVALSFVMLPGWVASWLAVVRGPQGYAPTSFLLTPAGPLIALAALRWRRPEARLILLLATIPHTVVPYEELPLCLVGTTFRESLVIAVGSMICFLVQWTVGGVHDELVRFTYVAALYLPCVAIVLRRPNEGLEIAWPFHRRAVA